MCVNNVVQNSFGTNIVVVANDSAATDKINLDPILNVVVDVAVMQGAQGNHCGTAAGEKCGASDEVDNHRTRLTRTKNGGRRDQRSEKFLFHAFFICFG